VLRVERKDAIAIWTIDRPESKNALDQATFEALDRAVREADASVRVAIVTGAGDMFVSGGDLRELRDKTSRADAEQLTDTGYALCRAIGEAPFPVIAALGGAAIGGGAELAVACDLRVASSSASLAFKQARLGVTTAWGTAERLVALVGAGRAARLLFTGETVVAAEAHAMGLVEVVHEGGGVLDAALELAAAIAHGSPAAVTAMKRLVRARGDRALERDLFVETWSGADHLEAVEAWFARRPPRWTR
jgi:enoyl-CoA hydratase